MSEGIDYSFARPGGGAIAAAGKVFVMRYVPYPGDGGKGLMPAERDDLFSHGLGIGLVFESTANRALGGTTAGVYDGNLVKQALTMLGWPSDRPVYFGVDFDASLAQQVPINAYLVGAASVIGKSRVGVYGGINVINRCKANGTATWFWQTYAWSGGQVAAGIHVYQYLNGQNINGAVDLDRSMAADYGCWFKGGDMAGLTVRLSATATATSPWTSFGTAVVNGSGKSGKHVADASVVAFTAGQNLGVVQKGTLVVANASWTAGGAIYVTNVDGQETAIWAPDVTFTAMTPPVPPPTPPDPAVLAAEFNSGVDAAAAAINAASTTMHNTAANTAKK